VLLFLHLAFVCFLRLLVLDERGRIVIRGTCTGTVPAARKLFRPVVGAARMLQPRKEKLLREGVEFEVETVQTEELAALVVAHLGLARVRLCVLNEVPGEVEPERVLEEEARLGLVLGESEERHVAQVVLGAVKHRLLALRSTRDGALVVAANEAEICEHSGLAVVSQVVRAGHEIREADPRPIRSCKK